MQTFSLLSFRAFFQSQHHTKVHHELSCFSASSDSAAKGLEVAFLSSHIPNAPEVHDGPEILPRALVLPWKSQHG